MKKYLFTVSATLYINDEVVKEQIDLNSIERVNNGSVILNDCIMNVVDIDTAENVCNGIDITKEVNKLLRKA